MAYKYFTQKLLSSDILDLTQVFPEKQETAKVSNNVSYNLADIAVFLQDRTENFKRIEPQYIDLDNAISEIVNKYYKSKNEKNPFLDELDEESLAQLKNKTPREAAVVKEGKIEGKGAPKAAPEKKEEPKKSAKIDKFKEELASRKEIYEDVYDDEEKAEFLELMQTKLEADELIAEDGDEYYIERVEILKNFIQQLKK